MSQAVLWEVVKNQHAFLTQNHGLKFSSDPFNNTGRNTYSSTGFIRAGAVGVNVSRDVKRNRVDVVVRKRVKYQQKSRDAKAGKTAQKDAQHTIYSAHLPVHHGVHTAQKVLRKRFGTQTPGLLKAAIRKLVKLNRANGVRAKHVAEDAKAAANKKK